MPQILELRIIDDALWCRVGKPGEFHTGITLYYPDELAEYRKAVVREVIYSLEVDLLGMHKDLDLTYPCEENSSHSPGTSNPIDIDHAKTNGHGNVRISAEDVLKDYPDMSDQRTEKQP